MRVVVSKWNFVDSQGRDSAVFVRYYYCETCAALANMENVETNGHLAHHEEARHLGRQT